MHCFVMLGKKQEALAMMFDHPNPNRDSFIHTRPVLHQLETLALFLSTTKKSRSLYRNQANTTLEHKIVSLILVVKDLEEIRDLEEVKEVLEMEDLIP